MTSLAEKSRELLDGQTWVSDLRQSGLGRFKEVGWPTTKDEEWRFTNVTPLAKILFRPAAYNAQPLAEELAARYSFASEAAIELVFVNGQFAPGLSTLLRPPKGVRIKSLAEAIALDASTVRQHLGRYATVATNAFVAMNTGHVNDGAYVHLAKGATVRGPIHLLFVSVPSGEPTVSHPRVLVVAEENTQASIVESYVGGGNGTCFCNAVTEVVAGRDARIDHCKLQQESLEAIHIATMQVELAAGANFVSHAATLGGKLTRNELNVILNGERAEATLNGLVIAGGEQHVDNHTLLRHEAANCPSHELYKHVLDGKAAGVFKGKIFVQQGAQKTDAKQTNKTLLLSDNATMDAMPALEIYADDVKCTHGSTTGPVDEEMVFYLRLRGIGLEAARHLLTYAFAADITRRIKVEPVRRRLEDFMAARHSLPQDLRITDLGSHDEAAR